MGIQIEFHNFKIIQFNTSNESQSVTVIGLLFNLVHNYSGGSKNTYLLIDNACLILFTVYIQ